jgi:hypothetical protein
VLLSLAVLSLSFVTNKCKLKHVMRHNTYYKTKTTIICLFSRVWIGHHVLLLVLFVVIGVVVGVVLGFVLVLVLVVVSGKNTTIIE